MPPEIKIKASLERSGFDTGIESMKSSAKQLNQSLGSIGGIMAGMFGGLSATNLISSAFAKLSDTMNQAQQSAVKLSHDAENIGIKPHELEEIVDTFKRFGAAGDDVVAMFGRLEGARNKALNGDDKAIANFKTFGLGLQEVAKMDPKELLDKIMAENAKASGSGDSGTAMQDIFGRSMRKPSMQRASLFYGGGGRVHPAFQSDDFATTALRMSEAKKDLSLSGIQRLLANTKGRLQTDENSWIENSWFRRKFGLDVKSADVTKEQQAQAEANAKKKQANSDAIDRANRERTERDKEIDAENEQFKKERIAEREEEIRRGAKFESPSTDAFRRRGMIAGNAPGITDSNSTAYLLGRQALVVQNQILESSRRIEANTRIQTRHQSRMAEIRRRYPGLGHGEDEEVVE